MMSDDANMNTTDKLAILLAKEGNESAFRELYEKNYEMIYRLAYRYSKSKQDAEDIMQDTFIKAFKGIKKFDFSISTNFSAWIYQVGYRCSMDYLRKRQRRRADQIESLTDFHNEPRSQDSSPETTTIANQTMSQVKSALDILSPKQRVIFDLRHLQHKALKEISERLQCSQSTVKKQLQRAVLKLRNQLEPLWREE
jgi:RNA polymerase sigma-70 factor (ECF subfamily)